MGGGNPPNAPFIMSHHKPPAPVPAMFSPTSPWARRTVMISGVAALVAACNARSFEDAGQALRLAIAGSPDVPVTREQIVQLPYATIRAKIGNGQRSVMVLFRYDGPDLHWVSADRVVFATRRARLVKTTGLASNLRHSAIVGEDPASEALGEVREPTRILRLVDIDPGFRYGIPVSSTMAIDGDERIEIVERFYDTVRLREHCVAPLLDWEFDNTYWADRRNGFPWKSVQHFSPDLPPLELEILKAATEKVAGDSGADNDKEGQAALLA